jgi:hypothetical protein
MVRPCPRCERPHPDDVAVCVCGSELAGARRSIRTSVMGERAARLAGVVLWAAAVLRGVLGVHSAVALLASGSRWAGLVELTSTAVTVLVAAALAITMRAVARVVFEVDDMRESLREIRRWNRPTRPGSRRRVGLS